MIPLSLVTGFLGSGKTTFLRRVIDYYRDRKLVYLVNEFSPLDVDGHVLAEEIGDLVALPGGSIFCTCLVTEFVGALTAIPDRFGADGTSVEGVVVEASGIANPKVVEKMLADTRLDQVYALSSVVTIVDPGTFPAVVQSLPNVVAQVESSDVVILNKTDIYDSTAAAAAEAEVRRIKPDANVLRAVQCDVDLETLAGAGLLGDGEPRGLEGELAPCADPNYARMSVLLKGDVELDRLRNLIEPMGRDLYRLKGFARVKGHVHYIDYTQASLTARRVGDRDVQPVLVLIVSGHAQGQGRELAAQIKQGAAHAEDTQP